MKRDENRKSEIEYRLSQLPKGKLSYKTIKGKRQPYLQWKENGRTRCDYIKMSDRQQIFIELEEKRILEDELRLLTLYSDKIADVIKDNAYISNKSAMGYQRFQDIIEGGLMYIDKTAFIEEWMSYNDQVTLITRPRRFGKTLMISTVECFFSTSHADKRHLFENTYIGKNTELMKQQGSIPTISITLADMKALSCEAALKSLAVSLYDCFAKFDYVLNSSRLSEIDKRMYEELLNNLSARRTDAITTSIFIMSRILYLHHNKPVLVLIDEYDTPMIEAFSRGYWEEMLMIMSDLFRSSFKTNSYLYKGILTGITRVAKESLFSDMNNLRVHSMISGGFKSCFGFTEDEVRAILSVRDLDIMDEIKRWYDGYTIVDVADIYNPWAILCFLAERKMMPYWANTGGNKLIRRVLKTASITFLSDFEVLLAGGCIHKYIDGHIVFDNLLYDENSIWSLLLSAGYLRPDNIAFNERIEGDLSITNMDARYALEKVIDTWFEEKANEYNVFCDALLKDDIDTMTDYLRDLFIGVVSFHDTAKTNEREGAERFYHGLVLGMIVSLRDSYEITSNRESGYGRYDIMMRPKHCDMDGIIIEFKVRNVRKETDISETVKNGLMQIEDRNYAAALIAAGVSEDNIRKYCMAFEGKEVLIERAPQLF